MNKPTFEISCWDNQDCKYLIKPTSLIDAKFIDRYTRILYLNEAVFVTNRRNTAITHMLVGDGISKICDLYYQSRLYLRIYKWIRNKLNKLNRYIHYN